MLQVLCFMELYQLLSADLYSQTLYTDIRYNDKIRYNDNLNGTIP